jgi:hypothetical protein
MMLILHLADRVIHGQPDALPGVAKRRWNRSPPVSADTLHRPDANHQQYTAKAAAPSARRLCPVRMCREMRATSTTSCTQHAATSPYVLKAYPADCGTDQSTVGQQVNVTGASHTASASSRASGCRPD